MAKYLDYEGLERYTDQIKENMAAASHKHAASDVTSGAFPTARIADGAVTAAKLASDVGIVAVSATEPTDQNVLFWVEITS